MVSIKNTDEAAKTFWVYILLCDNGSYYAGYTTDLKKRYQSHLDGTAKCKYTRSFKPVMIAQSWLIRDSKSLAMGLEQKIKRLSRQEKIQLIEQPTLLSTDPLVQVFGDLKIKSSR